MKEMTFTFGSMGEALAFCTGLDYGGIQWEEPKQENGVYKVQFFIKDK